MRIIPEFEDIAERILELLQTDPIVDKHVSTCIDHRFPKDVWDTFSQETKDEIICMEQTLVFKYILSEVV